MKKNYNVEIEDNGAAFLVVINKGTDNRLVIDAYNTLANAWEKIVWLYRIETQEFTVGKKQIPVTEWIDGMKKAGYID